MDKIKLSVAIAGENALPSAFVVWRGFEESIKKAKEYGYDGVELALKNEREIDINQMNRTLEKNNIGVSAVTTGQVFAGEGLFLTSEDENIREKAFETLSGLIRITGFFGGILNIGRVRGHISSENSEKYFIQMIERLCEAAEKENVTVIIEPVNRYEINFINNLDEGTALIKKINKKNLGLMPDVFHMNIEDDKIGESLKRNAEYIKYIHLADSNRLSPGCGHLDFGEVFSALRSVGYLGWLSAEVLPVPNPDEAAKKAADFILPYIHKYNGEENL